MSEMQVSGRGEARILNHTGDTKIIWSRDNPDEVANAKRTFDDLVKTKKFAAFSVRGKNGDKGEQIREFDPEAERIIFTPALRGG